VVSARTVEALIDVSQPTASALVRDLERLGILRELTGQPRNRLFAYARYLDFFPGVEDRG
jgi:Fic family protein